MDRFRVKVMWSYAEDSYEFGEVGKYTMDELPPTKYFDTPEEALQSFAELYGHGEMYRTPVEDGGMEYLFQALMADSNGYFREPTEKEQALWKQGRKRLYNVEWTGRIVRESPVGEINTNALPFRILEG